MVAAYFFVLLALFPQYCNSAGHPLLLLMSLDGFRYDFISPVKTPNIWFLAQNGVHAVNGIKTQVMTVTAPNHHCIATGLYQESHGIIDNVFYDPVFKESYDVWGFGGHGAVYKNSKLSKWYTGEPIWQTNMKLAGGRLSGTYFWPAGDAEINDIKPKHKYKTWLSLDDNYHSWTSEIDELLGWYTSEVDPINFALYYQAEPDMREHSADIHGREVEEIIGQVDKLIGYFVDQCKKLGIFDKLNLIITSDHGFADDVSGGSNPGAVHHSLSEYIQSDLVTKNSYSYFPADGKDSTAEEIYKNLSKAVQDGVKIKVWRKKDFPDKYHWKNNRRIGPVIYFNEMGYDIDHGRPTHFGYLNDDKQMNVIFVAYGPAFKKGYKLIRDDVENVDLYPLMCHILKLDPAPNNGSLARLFDILSNDCRTVIDENNEWVSENLPKNFKRDNIIAMVIVFSVLGLFLLMLYVCLSRRHLPQRAKRRQSNSMKSFLQSFIQQPSSLTRRKNSNDSSANNPFLRLDVEKDLSGDEEF